MKFNILLFIFSLLFIGCSDSNSSNKFKIDSFNKGSKFVCYNKESTGSSLLANSKHVDKVLVDKDTYMLVNQNKNIIIKDLSVREYNIENCTIVQEKDIFELDDGIYVILNGVAKKLKTDKKILSRINYE